MFNLLIATSPLLNTLMSVSDDSPRSPTSPNTHTSPNTIEQSEMTVVEQVREQSNLFMAELKAALSLVHNQGS